MFISFNDFYWFSNHELISFIRQPTTLGPRDNGSGTIPFFRQRHNVERLIPKASDSSLVRIKSRTLDCVFISNGLPSRFLSCPNLLYRWFFKKWVSR